MGNSLGSLYFALGLDDSKFKAAIEAAKQQIEGLGADVTVGIQIDLNSVAKKVQNELTKLNGLTGGDKTIGLEVQVKEETVNAVRAQLEALEAQRTVKLSVEYDSEKFQSATTALKNYTDQLNNLGKIRLGIDDEFLRAGASYTKGKGFKGFLSNMSEYLFGDDGGETNKSIGQIQKILNTHTFKLKTEVDQQAIVNSLNAASKKKIPLNVDVNIDIAEIQKRLNKLKVPLTLNSKQAIDDIKSKLKNETFKAKLELVIDKAKVSKAVKAALAKQGLNYNTTASDVRAKRIEEIQQKMDIRQKKFNSTLNKSVKNTKSLGRGMKLAGDWAGQLYNKFGNFISIYAIGRFIRNLYTIGGEFQKQQIALRSMIGDVTQADSTFERLKDLAVKSPFTFSDLASYTKQMAAYGIEYEELYDTTKRLADISAGVGVDMGRLILAYGQVRSAEVLRGQELRQFTEAGIPLVAELAKRLEEVRGKSVKVGEVFDAISKRQVSFEMVKDVLFDMTDPGGRFFEMQEELAKSLAGQWSNLKDAWDIMIADIANSSSNVLSGLAATAADILRSWRDWIPALAAVAAAIGTVTSAIRVYNTVATIANTITKASPWGIAASVIIGVVGAIGGWVIASNIAKKNTSQLNTELEQEIQKWNENRENALRYIDTLKSSNTTEERRIKLYNELLELYPELFKDMKLEQILLADTARLKTDINEETARQQLKLIEDDIKVQEKIIKDLNDSRRRETASGSIVVKPLSEEDKKALEEAKAQIAYLQEKKAEIQKLIDREDKIRKLTPDSSIDDYIEVYHNLAKAVKILRKGGVIGSISNPKEFTPTLEYYDQLSTALKEQEEISKKFKIGTPERADADKLVKVYRDAISAIGGIWDTSKSRKRMSDAAKIDMNAYIEALKNEIARIGKQWDLFKDLLEASGNKDLSMNIAFGGQISFDNQLEQLKSRIIEEAKKFGVGIGLYDLLGLGEKQLLEKGVSEKAAKSIGALVDAYNKENAKLKDESVRNFIEILKASKDFEQQIADVERKLKKDLEDLRNNSEGMPNDEYARRRSMLIKKANEDSSKIRFEEFKESSNWVKVFDDLDMVSSNTLDLMTSQIKEFSKQTSLSQDEVKQLVEAMRKLREETVERNPLKAFKDAWNNLSDLNNAVKGKSNGKIVYTVTSKDGTIKQYDEEEYNQAKFAEQSGLGNATVALVSKFDAVGKAASILGDFFDSAGVGVSHFLEAISSVTGTAISGAQAGANIGSVFGGKGGMYGAIAGAALGMLTALFSQVDKSLQRSIEASERREKKIGNIAQNLEKALERNMGGMFTMEIDDKTNEAFSKVIESYNNTQNAIKEWNDGEVNMELFRQIREYAHLQEDTIDTIKDALNEDSYFDAQLAALKIQRDEVQKQMDLEDEKKKTDKNKMLDYEQQIHELDDAINHFAEDMANALYGIDFKDWSEKLAESLVDAWASGEDAVQAYRDTVNDILKDLGVSIISQKILQPLLDKTMTDFLAQFEKDNGVLTDSSLEILAGMADGAEYAASATEAYLEGLKKLGIDLSNTSEEAKSGLSKGIQSVTEDTADLLASYVNAIRADVSVKRSLIEKLIAEDIPQMNYLAQAQLQQLQMIVANTKRNADAATEIRDLFNRVVDKGNNKLKI